MELGMQVVNSVGKIAATKAPLISVVLPVFNAEKYVEDAVRSVLQQTFRNFELIVINDGSTDGTRTTLEYIACEDDRIRLISRENKGLVETLNEGISLASGKWIARMDADDIALPDRFERQLQWLQETDADICGSWIRLFGAADTHILKHAQTDSAIKMELLFGAPFAHPSVMMRRALVKELRYDKAWEKAEDYDLWERAVRGGWKMTNVPEVLLHYRQHDTQISTVTSSRQQYLTQEIRHRYWTFIFEQIKLNKEWIDEILKLRMVSPSQPNMDKVDQAFAELLEHNSGEARAIVFEHATRLYFRAAAGCPDIVARWDKLNRDYGPDSGMVTKARLWLLSVLHIQTDGQLFERLKRFYLSLRGIV